MYTLEIQLDVSQRRDQRFAVIRDNWELMPAHLSFLVPRATPPQLLHFISDRLKGRQIGTTESQLVQMICSLGAGVNPLPRLETQVVQFYVQGMPTLLHRAS